MEYRQGSFLSGVAEACLTITLYTLAGAAITLLLNRSPSETTTSYYTGAMEESCCQEPAEKPLWLVDGYNLLHRGLIHGRSRGRWWGSKGRNLVLEALAELESPEHEIWVVFDGNFPAPDAELEKLSQGRPQIQVFFAASADEWLVHHANKLKASRRIKVVTGDRQLAARSQHRGAEVVDPKVFLRQYTSQKKQLSEKGRFGSFG